MTDEPLDTGVEFSRLMKDLELGRVVQRSFAPVMPDIPGYTFAATYQPAMSIGGDHHDFIKMASGQIVAIVADVAGKGIPACLLKTCVATAFHFALSQATNPIDALAVVNDYLVTATNATDRFVTAVIAVLDPVAHTVEIASAGHMPPLLYRTTENLWRGFDETWVGLPLGINDGQSYETRRVALQPGDTLLLYSDGVTDAQNETQEPFGSEGVRRLVVNNGSSAWLVLSAISSAVEQHMGVTKAQIDDITIVCITRNRSEG